MTSEDARFDALVAAVRQTHATFSTQAGRAVNISLTLRNWFIGHHIAEYELHGSDRAGYGERLLEQLAGRLGQTGLKRLDVRELRRFHQFYKGYPQIREALSPVLASLPAAEQLSLPRIREAPSPESSTALAGPAPRLLLERLSSKGDRAPIGILLCTQKNHEMVQFALADMNNRLFVSRYQLQLPAAEEMEEFLRRAMGELGAGA